MTLLTICTDAADEIGIPQPATIINNSDPSVLQLLRSANREGKTLLKYHWEVLKKEGSVTSLAAESQGLLTAIETNFLRIANDTIYDRTSKFKIFGPLTDTQWQRLKASTASGVRHYFRIRGGSLLILPQMISGHAVFFEYFSKNWVDIGTGATPAVADGSAFNNDANTVVFDEELMSMGVVWRFLKGKGLPYTEQKNEYLEYRRDLLTQDGAKATINMTGGIYEGWFANVPEIGFGV
jgi:hypothetical protein|tara:strand:- start:80 stop:793 length:714 start_codon:yes stop_codon:yes gene_type:complete